MSGQRGRGHGARQDAEPLAFVALLLDAIEFLAECRYCGFVRDDRAATSRRLRAIRIVQVEERGLNDYAGAAEAGRMIGIAFDLGGPAFVAANDDAGHVATNGTGRSEEQRHAGRHLLRLIRVGNDFAHRGGAGRTASGTGQGQRGTHHGQEAATAHRIGPLGRIVRELVLHGFPELRAIHVVFQTLPKARFGETFVVRFGWHHDLLNNREAASGTSGGTSNNR